MLKDNFKKHNENKKNVKSQTDLLKYVPSSFFYHVYMHNNKYYS